MAYLSEHPDANDTLEGIMHWWLLEQSIKHWTAEVQGAVAGLVAEGLIVESRDREGRAHYRVNRRKIKKIEGLLKRAGGEGNKVAF